jgi:hypothetical protein
MYELMQDCWKLHSSQRPTFEKARSEIETVSHRLRGKMLTIYRFNGDEDLHEYRGGTRDRHSAQFVSTYNTPEPTRDVQIGLEERVPLIVPNITNNPQNTFVHDSNETQNEGNGRVEQIEMQPTSSSAESDGYEPPSYITGTIPNTQNQHTTGTPTNTQNDGYLDCTLSNLLAD